MASVGRTFCSYATRQRLLRGAFLAVVAAGAVPLAFAQLDNGSITGQVRDGSGAVIPDAAVTIRNVATGVAANLKTNGDGTYQALALIPGTYSVDVTAPGFTTAHVSNVEVHVKTRAEIDVDMKAGATSETVEVVSTATGLQTQSADVGNVIGTTQINDLPLNARRYADLALLEPGIFKNPGAANPAPDRFSSNGNLETQNYFALDGVDNNSGSTNLQEGSVQNVQPPPDAIQEFRLQTRTYSAEFGTSAGAIVNASIKSGTNALHGSVWEYARNSAFDANSWANKHTLGTPLPKGNFSQNQFGGTVGGHILRDKAFYFGDYQGLRSTQSTTVNSVVPSAAMKNGDMSEVTFNPVAQLASQAGCIVNKVVLARCIDPVALAVAKLLPDPNNASGPWNGTPNYIYQYQQPQQVNSFDVRTDLAAAQRHQLFTRYSYLDQHRQDPPWTGNPDIGNGGFATDYRIRNQGVAFGVTSTLTSTSVNQFRFGWGRDSAHSNPIGVTLGTSAAPSVGLTGIPVTPQSGGLPPLNVSGGFRRIGVDLFRPQFQAAGVWQFLDNFTKLKGNHSLLFGYEYHRTTNNFLDLTAPQGYMGFSGIFTNTNGFGWGDFLLGNVNQTFYNSYLVVHNYQFGHSFFAQDTWRASDKLTLIYGTRYELYSPLLNRNNAFANFDPSGAGALTVATGGSWAQRSLVQPDKNNFAPRVGFAYQPSSKVVLRGGFGVFYQYMNRVGSESQLGQNQPFLKFVNDARTTVASGTIFQLRNGFPGAVYANTTTPLYIQKTNWQQQNQRTSYVEQFSFGPQVQLSASTTVEAVYVGNLGRKMNRLRNANQGLVTGFSGANPVVAFPFANLNSGGSHAFLEYATNDGVTNYNGLVTSLRRAMTHGLGYQVSYTYAHNFADFADNLTAGSTPQNAYDYEHEYSQSPFDQRHRLVISAQWKLPVGPGGLLLTQKSIASTVLGGWQYNIIASFESGNPFNITAADNSGTGGNHAAYANCLAGAFNGTTRDRAAITSITGTASYLNAAAFTQPVAGTFGSCRPRPYAGPGRRNFDMSLFKQFAFTDARRAELRLEGFNVFNHANLANPASSVTTPGTFGRISGVVNTARQVQVAAKFYF